MMRARMCRLAAGLTLVLLLIPACRGVSTSYRYPQDLSHPDYVKRSKALRHFAQERDADRLPQAFPLLTDEDANIRMLAHRSIASLMPGGEDFGYRPYLPAAQRIRLAAQWQAWWEKGGAREAEGG